MINSLFDALNIEPYKMISIIGGGGKTTLMFSLAKELKAKGKKVAVTTSTHIMKPSVDDITDLVIMNPDEQAVINAFKNNTVVAFGNDSEGKMGSPEPEFFNYIKKYVDYVFVEADGSKRLPFKAPRDYEPVYPQENEYTIIVAGLSAIGCPIKEKCHRANLLCNIIKKDENEILTAEDMAEVIISSKGQLKDIKNFSKVTLVLNQADDEQRIKDATEVANIVFKKRGIKTVIATLNKDTKVKKCVEA